MGDPVQGMLGRSVCRFKDSGTGGTVFADLRIPGRGYGGGSVCRFKDSGTGRWVDQCLQI